MVHERVFSKEKCRYCKGNGLYRYIVAYHAGYDVARLGEVVDDVFVCKRHAKTFQNWILEHPMTIHHEHDDIIVFKTDEGVFMCLFQRLRGAPEIRQIRITVKKRPSIEDLIALL